MARKHRVWFPGAFYHITARGNRRSTLYNSEDDYETYLQFLEDVRTIYPFKLHSYCLMTNHLHLQLETIDFHIKFIMKELHSRYAVYFNKKYQLDGHVFQGRYGAKLIESADYFLEVSRYIHRNPLEAKMVQNLASYEWSSYSAYLNLKENPHVTLHETLSYFQEPMLENYQLFVEKEDAEAGPDPQ